MQYLVNDYIQSTLIKNPPAAAGGTKIVKIVVKICRYIISPKMIFCVIKYKCVPRALLRGLSRVVCFVSLPSCPRLFVGGLMVYEKYPRFYSGAYFNFSGVLQPSHYIQ